jgi:hypothetical protein
MNILKTFPHWSAGYSSIYSCFQLVLYGGFVSGSLFSWDLTNSKPIHSFQGHNSAVTGFEVRKTAFESHAFFKYYERGQVTRRKGYPSLSSGLVYLFY